MSQALYRRYRSRTFADLIGQDHIVATLRNQVRSGEVAHAYLFTGIRGTGKTSAARILARAVNCLDLREGEPCNRCGACAEVLGGAAVDVLEIDAASNRGIDEIRDLREKVKFSPALLRRKVYIVDEAHMLTTDAWNAFLKTLEEPPDHVLFVLATTEPHKVPETVRSRVQRFDFRRVSTEALAAHLRMVVGEEGAAAADDALVLVAQAGQGSVRDALSVLDQALGTGERPLTVATVRRALGLADPAALRAVLVGVAAADAAAALRGAGAAFDAGADARQLLREMARLARGAELAALGYPQGAAGEEAELCAELAAAGRPGLWVDAIERFAEAEINLRQPVDSRLQVELALLRLAHGAPAGLEERLARLEAAAGIEGSALAPPPPPRPATAPAPVSPVPRLPVPPPPGRPAAGSGPGAAVPDRTARSAAAPSPAAAEPSGGDRAAPDAAALPPAAPPPGPSAAGGLAAEAGVPGPPDAGDASAAGPAVADQDGGPAGEAPGRAAPVEGAAVPPPVAAAAAAVADPAAEVRCPPPAAACGPAAPADLDAWTAAWPGVIDLVNRRDAMLAGVLRSCRPCAGEAGRLVVGAPYGFHLERLREARKAALLAEAVAAVAGRPCTVEAVFSGEPPDGGGAAAGAPEAEADVTAAVLAAFPGARLTGSVLRDSDPDGP